MEFLRWPVIALYLGTPALLAVMALAYAGIGWMLWLSRRTMDK
jgi:hypothetical protein